MPEEEVEANAASAYLLFYARHDLLQASALDFQRDVYPALLHAARAAEEQGQGGEVGGVMSEEALERFVRSRDAGRCVVQ